jgi:hypothetical protein
MSDRNEHHYRAIELHKGPSQAHLVAEKHGKGEHLTGHEQTRQAVEHSKIAYQHELEVQQQTASEHEIKQREIAALAHKLWQDRGSPEGSSQDDWFRAEEMLRSRS